jgi:hypothetical protein
MRYQNIPPRYQIKPGARHKIKGNESHGAFDGGREGWSLTDENECPIGAWPRRISQTCLLITFNFL